MEWTPQTLQQTLKKLSLHGAELPGIEVKKALEGYPKNTTPQTLCAFSNMPEGGSIIFGIDEATGFTPVGVYNITELEKAVSSALRNALKPKGQATFTHLTLEGKDILVADINPLPITDRPCYYNGKAYMRHSDGDYAMGDYEITRILASRERPQYDLVCVAGSSLQDLDASYTEKFVASAQLSSSRHAGRPKEQILVHKSVMKQGELTLAGLYAMGDYPQQFFPSLKVSGVVEGEMARNLDKFEADGPLPEMLENAVQWLARNLRTAVAEDGQGGLKNKPEIPLIVLRELVANALVHRALDPDSVYAKDVTLRIKPDRIIITNPGGLWAITASSLAEPGHKTAVNSGLYEICKLAQTPSGARVIEGEGSGIYEAQKAMSREGLLPIEFIDKGIQFTAIIWRAPLAMNAGSLMPEPRNGSTHEFLYAYLLRSGQQTIADLVKGTGLTRRQVGYNLEKLEESGRVVSERPGGAKARLYRAVIS